MADRGGHGIGDERLAFHEPGVVLSTRGGAVLLALALTIAAVLRFGGLADPARALGEEELLAGLDARALWDTGRDTRGVLLPLDARPEAASMPMFARYLMAPWVGGLGLLDLGVRLPSALGGLLLVLATYLLVRRRLGELAAGGAAIGIALSPMAVHFSRVGVGAIWGPALFTLGLALLDRAAERPRTLVAAALSLGLSLHADHAMKPFAVVMLPLVALAHQDALRAAWAGPRRRALVAAAVAFAVVAAPAAFSALLGGGAARAAQVVVLLRPRGVLAFFEHWLGWFDPSMLVVHATPHDRQAIRGLGEVGPLELLALLPAAFALARGELASRDRWLLAAWLALGPIASGLGVDARHAGRAVPWLPAPALVVGVGLAHLATRTSTRVLLAGLAVAAAGSAALTGYVLFAHHPRHSLGETPWPTTRAIRCAVDDRRDRTVVVSPRLRAAESAAAFYLGGRGVASRLGEPPSPLAANERYVLPGKDAPPDAETVCAARGPTGEVAAIVVERTRPRFEIVAPPDRTRAHPIAPAPIDRDRGDRGVGDSPPSLRSTRRN